MMLPVTQRLLRYTQINTTANPANAYRVVPSSSAQHQLADLLVDELKQAGIQHIEKLDNATVIATLPARGTNSTAKVGWICHLDTHFDQTTDTKAQRIAYHGGDVVLNAEKNIVMRAEDFPELQQYIGDHLITTDGTSLLGADNKSAIAAVMEAVHILIAHPDIPHAEMRIIFVPDEEIGLVGAKLLDPKQINIDYGYTLDCCQIGEIVVENWNAGEYVLNFKGQTAHPMSSKGKMKNSIWLAYQFLSHLPAGERPEYTEGKEGYFWVKEIKGNVGNTQVTIDIRDFTCAGFSQRQEKINALVNFFNQQYGDIVTAQYQTVYENVAAVLTEHPHVTEMIVTAMNNLEITPHFKPMRGGFDGAALVQHGIPVANIFCGAHHFHSIYEFIPEHSLQQAANMVVEIMRLSASH